MYNGVTMTINIEDYREYAMYILNLFLRRNPRYYYMRNDLESEVLYALWQSVERFEPERGFAFGTLASKRINGAIIDYIRFYTHCRALKSRREVTLDPEHYDLMSYPDAFVEDIANKDEASKIISRLPRVHRKLLKMHYLENISQRAIAEKYNTSVTTVNKIISSAKRFLQGDKLALKGSYTLQEQISTDC